MTTATIARRQNVLQRRFAWLIVNNQKVKITRSASLPSHNNTILICDECQTPIDLRSIPVFNRGILCPDCIKKYAGALLDQNAAKANNFFGEIKK